MTETSAEQATGWRKYGSLLLNTALVVAAFLIVSAFQARHLLAVDRQPAPALEASTLSGDRYDLRKASGHPVLVYFFAPWCNYCAASSGNLVRLRQWRDTSELEIVAVALDWESRAEVRDYVERHALNIPVLLGDRSIARDWQVYAFPTYYVLDSQQRLVHRDLGYSTRLGLWFRSWRVD